MENVFIFGGDRENTQAMIGHDALDFVPHGIVADRHQLDAIVADFFQAGGRLAEGFSTEYPGTYAIVGHEDITSL